MRKRELEDYQGREDGVDPKVARVESGVSYSYSSSEDSSGYSSEDSPEFSSEDSSEYEMGDDGVLPIITKWKGWGSPDKISLSAQGLTKVSAERISNFLKTDTMVTSLKISYNPIGYLGAQYISEALTSCGLTKLSVTSCCIGDKGFKYIISALKDNTSLRSLIVGNNGITAKGMWCMLDNLKNNLTLTYIDLIDNAIGSGGFRSLCTLIKGNVGIAKLGLGNIGISDGDAQYAYETLRGNTRIISLDLRCEDISGIGASYLNELAKDSCILNLEYSNKSENTKRLLRSRRDFVYKLAERWVKYKVGESDLSAQFLAKLHKYFSATHSLFHAYVHDDFKSIVFFIGQFDSNKHTNIPPELTLTFKQDFEEKYQAMKAESHTFWRLAGITKDPENLPYALMNEDITQTIVGYLGAIDKELEQASFKDMLQSRHGINLAKSAFSRYDGSHCK